MSSTGHYVVISGYDATTDEFEIRDPASSRYSYYLIIVMNIITSYIVFYAVVSAVAS